MYFRNRAKKTGLRENERCQKSLILQDSEVRLEEMASFVRTKVQSL